MSGPVRSSIDAGLATITLARPEAGNAMNWDLVDAFSAEAGKITADPSVRAILIEAEGKNFCVGGDIRAFASEQDPAGFLGALARRLHEGVALLAASSAPVVVAVQGAAAGAGLSLVAGGDIVLGATSSSYAMAYTGIGLTADGGATWLLPRVIGLRRAQELAYTNRRLTAAEAERYGLVTRLVDDTDLATEARALATRLASGPTGAYGGVKALFAQTDRNSFVDHLETEAVAIEQAMASADAAEGIAAFLGRRAPSFTGA